MSWFRPKSAKGRRLGIGFQSKGISLVDVDDSRGERAIRHCGFYPAEGFQAQGEELTKLVRELKLKDSAVNVVLDPGMYSLLQVEAPEVEPEELRSALRWRIKDLIDFHIDDAVLDVFDLPESKRQGVPRLMYVVATRANLIQQVVDQTERAGLRINSIDINELSIRNLIAGLFGPESVQALLYLGATQGSIEISKGDILYLTRRLAVTAGDLQGQGEFAQDELLDNLVLELQRSLDYYESQFGQGPASSVVVLTPEGQLDRLVDYADANLLISAKSLSLSDYFTGLEQVADADLIMSITVIGAALRSD
ncbi:MAG: hypothetical protein C0631_13930 [Sedimenticola sp.]|nr:MAG: hypothetical protein C0631_13930 [Sedimenticola sp.]